MVERTPGDLLPLLARRPEPSGDLNRWFLACLDVVASLGRELRTGATRDTEGAILAATRTAVEQILSFRATAFLTVDDELDFQVASCEPVDAEPAVQSAIAEAVEDGSFGWAVSQNRPVVTRGTGSHGVLLLHSLTTPSRVIGTFAGLLDSESAVVPDVEQKLLSIVLFHCASALETSMLYRDLARHTEDLERRVDERTGELRRSEQSAREAARIRSEFLAVTSHELRTPLNGMVGMCDLLLESGLDAEQRDCAESIRSTSDAILTIVNDILDFSKIEAGELDVHSAAFDLRTVVEEVVDMLRPAADEKGLEIHLDYGNGAPTRLIGDGRRIRQILVNLAGNAIKFTKRGEVCLRVECEGRTVDAAHMHLSVTDTGIGIPEESLEAVFDRFVRGREPGVRAEEGAGLGLAVSRELAIRLGGGLSVESRVGEGSTFGLSLSLRLDRSPPSAAAPAPAATAVDFSDTRVLVVEDDPLNQKVEARILEKLGCAVDVAADGLEALEQVAQRRYDVIFMDCRMPDMDGFRATAEIRGRADASRRTPIVAITAGVLDGDREQCLRAGMDDYVSKPVRQSDLRRMLERWARPGSYP